MHKYVKFNRFWLKLIQQFQKKKKLNKEQHMKVNEVSVLFSGYFEIS